MKKQIVFPPRLSMDAYADHFEKSLKTIDPAKRIQQKNFEERIERAFNLDGKSESSLDDAKSTSGR